MSDTTAMLSLLLACAPEEPDKPAGDDTHVATDSPTESTPTDSPVDTVPTETATETGDDTGTTPTTPEPAPVVQFTGDRPTNLLVISLDTTRRDQLGIFSGLDTTPFLDSLLAEGVLLEDHRTCSNWTIPSVLCATTGLFPLDEGWWPTSTYDGGGDSLIAGIPEELPTIASILLANGYSTGLVTANPLITSSNNGVVSGFETVVNRGWSAAPAVNQAGLTMTRQLLATGNPWYLHLHYMDPHSPYSAPAEYAYELDALEAAYPDFAWDVRDSAGVYSVMGYWPYFTEEEAAIAREFLFAVYRAELRYWDEQFAEMWGQLDALGMLDDTLVVFWTDHGEQFGEHDGFMHGVSLHSQENRSTAAYWARNIVPARWTAPTIHTDTPPTILDALGFPPAPEHTGIVVGLAEEERTLITFDYLVGYAPVLLGATRAEDQLLYSYGGAKVYYDLTADPAGDTNLYDATTPEVLELWTELDPYMAWLQTNWPHLVPVRPGP